MPRPAHLFVFCCDISRDSARSRVSELLQRHLTRVQDSVFEGRLTIAQARRLASQAACSIGPEDSLRAYCLSDAGRRASIVHGPRPLAEADDFWLL